LCDGGNVAWSPGGTADAWLTAPRRRLHSDKRGILCGGEASELSLPESKVHGRRRESCHFTTSDSSLICRVLKSSMGLHRRYGDAGRPSNTIRS
jgi:hypothetical protein